MNEPETEPDNGHAIALVVIVCTLLVILTLGLARVGLHAIDQSRARTAADAVALAVASGGASAGYRLAAANHATILRLVDDNGTIRVTVRVADMTATAAATLAAVP